MRDRLETSSENILWFTSFAHSISDNREYWSEREIDFCQNNQRYYCVIKWREKYHTSGTVPKGKI